MLRFVRYIKKLYIDIKDLRSRNDVEHYDVLMGFVSSILIAILELTSYFFVDLSQIKSADVYLLSGIWMIMQTIIFYSVMKTDYKTDSKFLKLLMFLHPFMIIGIGIVVTYNFQGFSNQIYSYIIAVFAASLIQMYSPKKRIAIFVLAPLFFNYAIYSTHGFSPLFFENLRISLMLSLLGYVYTTVQYNTDVKRRSLLTQLEKNNYVQKESYTELQEAYSHLDQSHRITEGMMRITTEILENDQFDDVLQMVLEEAIKVVPKAQAGSILIYNGEVMEYRAAFGYSLKNLQKITLKIDDLFQSQLEDMYAPAIIQDLKVFDEAHVEGETVKKLHEEGALVAQSILTCSFKHNDQFYGSINLDNFESKTIFDETDKRMIKHLAKQIEITIAIHKLYGKAITQTRYDVLTQAVSRRYHQELLEKRYEEARKTRSPFAICSIDLNNLKKLNDQFGHNAGDEALRYFSNIIRKLKDNNVIFSRLGGDEFMLIYPDSVGLDVLDKIESMRQFFSENPLILNHEKVIVTFGCGIATYPYDSDVLEDLVNLSDQRMYDNKTLVKQQNQK